MIVFIFFLFNDTATTEIYTYCHTLSLHDALPISRHAGYRVHGGARASLDAPDAHRQAHRQGRAQDRGRYGDRRADHRGRSEEHTSELQSLMRISYDVFCLKKKTLSKNQHITKHESTQTMTG